MSNKTAETNYFALTSFSSLLLSYLQGIEIAKELLADCRAVRRE